MTSNLILLTGIAYLLLGIFIGFYIATHRLVNNPEFQARLEELREIRYHAERARTMYAVAKMMERVNKNILLAMIDEFNKQVEANIERLKNADKK